jgi:hypothetical protein
MRRVRFTVLLILTAAAPASAQSVYQSPDTFEFFVDAFVRQEWDRDVYQGYETAPPDPAPNPYDPYGNGAGDPYWGAVDDPYGDSADDPYPPSGSAVWGNTDRLRLRALPRLRINLPNAAVVVGGDFAWTSEDNLDPAPGTLADNYRANEARLDLAYLDVQPTGWLGIEAGRFPMPVGYSEMIWDHDLRPQGGAVTLSPISGGDVLEGLDVIALFAKGSHVFEDRSEMFAGAVEATFATGFLSNIVFTGSYTTWRELDTLEPFLWRQNRRDGPGGPPAGPFDVVDGVVRFNYFGGVPFTLLANVCLNTAVDDENLGLWLGAAAGGFGSGRWAAEYTYARVDRDATVAAFGADDYLWVTGWEGHRGQLDIKLLERPRSASVSTLSARAAGILTRYKDSPIDVERDHWSKRFRLELVLDY